MRIQGPLLLYQYAMSLIQSLLKAADRAPLTLSDFDSEYHRHHTELWSPVWCILIRPTDKFYGFHVLVHMEKKNLAVSPHFMYIKGCSWYLKKQIECSASSIIKGSWFLTDVYAVSQCYLLYLLQKIPFRSPVIPPAAVPLDLVKSLSLLWFATYLFLIC